MQSFCGESIHFQNNLWTGVNHELLDSPEYQFLGPLDIQLDKTYLAYDFFLKHAVECPRCHFFKLGPCVLGMPQGKAGFAMFVMVQARLSVLVAQSGVI